MKRRDIALLLAELTAGWKPGEGASDDALQKARTALAVSLRAGITPAEMHTRLHQLRIVSDIGSPPRSQTPDSRSSAHVESCRLSLRYTHLLIAECSKGKWLRKF